MSRFFSEEPDEEVQPKVFCEELGCTADGIVDCFLSPTNEQPDHHYCYNHAFDEGFCPSCGQFYGGIESFEFSPQRMCMECVDMWKTELGEDDEYDDDYDDDYEY